MGSGGLGNSKGLKAKKCFSNILRGFSTEFEVFHRNPVSFEKDRERSFNLELMNSGKGIKHKPIKMES
jgi:hypothetical protein